MVIKKSGIILSMDKQEKVGASYQQPQLGWDIGGMANGLLYESLKGGLEIGLGVLRGMSAPFATFSALGRKGDYLPLPGTYGLDDNNQVNVNRTGEVWKYRIGTGIGLLADAAFGVWAVTGGLSEKEHVYLALGLATSNIVSVGYEAVSGFSRSIAESRRAQASSVRTGVGAPKLKE